MWHTRVDAVFQINPALPEETKEMLRRNHEARPAVPG